MQKKTFNVLERDINLSHHYFIEASAGTGKTFSIENIFLRLLLEERALTLDQILVVTFTKAATKDLKERLRKNLEKTIQFFDLNQEDEESPAPDFIKQILEKDSLIRKQKKKILQKALCFFNEAQIFTIHGFCSKILNTYAIEGDFNLNASSVEKNLGQEDRLNFVRDFFRTSLTKDLCCLEQFKILMQAHQNDIQELEKKLCQMLEQPYEIVPSFSFQQALEIFLQKMNQMKTTFHLNSQKLKEDLNKLFESIKNRKKSLSLFEENISWVCHFLCRDHWSEADFRELLENGPSMVNFFNLLPSVEKSEQLEGLPSNQESCLFSLVNWVKNELIFFTMKVSHPWAIFSTIASSCQKKFKEKMQENEKFSPDDLLESMLKALTSPSFVTKIRQRYQVAIIDEFQDTDPTQWKIFETLFLDPAWKNGSLILVGDPKQAIYSFRQADIYTYCRAAKAISYDFQRSLTTNYRAHPPLIDAINFIFSEEVTPRFIHLPRSNENLPVVAMQASPFIKQKIFPDKLGSIHFFIAKGDKGRAKKWPTNALQEKFFFPFIAEEIKKLVSQYGFSFNQIAVLVKDRFQAKAVADYLKSKAMAVDLQKLPSLKQSAALNAMKDLLEAVNCPWDRNLMRIASYGKIIRLPLDYFQAEKEGLQEKNDSQRKASDEELLISEVYNLRKILLEKTFAEFFYKLLRTKWCLNDRTVQERLVLEESCDEFYSDLMQIGDLLIDYQNETKATALKLYDYLLELKTSLDEDKDELKSRLDGTKNGINILTLHASKGLEYEIVFGLGLVNRSPTQEIGLIPIISEERKKLSFDIETDSLKRFQHIQELEAEKARLFYVGVTRAKYRLYLPVAVDEKKQSISFGTMSAIEVFLSKFSKSNLEPIERLESSLKEESEESLDLIEQVKKIAQKQQNITYEILEEKTVSKIDVCEKKSLPLIIPERFIMDVPIANICSFSSLLNSIKSENEILTENSFSEEIQIGIKNVHTLPSGPNTGKCLHDIFEKISFSFVREVTHEKELISLMTSFLKGTVLEGWEEVVAEIVFHTLKKNLTIQEETFSLSQIDEKLIHRELEFLYPIFDELNIPEMSASDGFLKGYIDLFFEHQGKYYFVDWKSNWLGIKKEDYREAALSKEMKTKNYFLQAKIYQEALKKYIGYFDKRPFEECFGGFFYLFLRGIDSRDECNCGIWYERIC